MTGHLVNLKPGQKGRVRKGGTNGQELLQESLSQVRRDQLLPAGNVPIPFFEYS